MSTLARDTALALVSGVALLGVLAVTDGFASLWDPRAVGLGLGAGVLVEALFLAGTPVVGWWERPWVGPASGAALVGVALAVALVVGPLAVAAACWGLVVYFASLALVVTGRWPSTQ